MKVLLYLLLCSIRFIQASSYINQTIYESLRTLSPLLHESLSSSSSLYSNTNLIDLLNEAENITLLLPDMLSINQSISAGVLNYSDPFDITSNTIRYMILNSTYNSSDFLSSRSYYSTIFEEAAEISIGPMLNTYYQLTNNIEIYSGMTKGKIIVHDIQCKNGLIHVIDNFLLPAQTPLGTISALSATEYMEELLKSLNISVSNSNRTVLIPIDKAWEGTNLPYGTLLHDLQYVTIQGVYTSDQLLSTTNFVTDYLQSTISIQYIDHVLRVNNASNILETDILTTTGVIHLIDAIIEPTQAQDATSPTHSVNTSHAIHTTSYYYYYFFIILIIIII